MKHHRFWIMFGLIVVLLIPLSVVTAQGPTPKVGRAPSVNVGTAFTYQGQLKLNGAPVTDVCDFQFGLYDTNAGIPGTQIGITQTALSINVTNGLFTAPINDLGQFGTAPFNGNNRYLGIAVACPHGSLVTTTITANSRQILTAAPYAFALPGLYTQPNATSPNVIGGYSGNVINPTVVGGTIGGGGYSGWPNNVWADYGTVGGGYDNTASGGVSTIGGGDSNTASGIESTIGGGYDNTASGSLATTGGGIHNTASNYAATVSGGQGNLASGMFATIPGGASNTATMSFTLAAGLHANAVNKGAFVWADSTMVDFTSTANDQFLVRAAGGVGINTNNTTANTLTVNGKVIAGGTGVPAGSDEPFVSRGAYSGVSMDDRAGGTNPRWVMYPSAGTLRFYNSTIGDALSINTAGNVAVPNLGVAGSDHLCRNASNQIATCSSSLRYKHNVANLDLGLAAVAQLRPIVFDWNDTNAPDLGFVAEEVNQVTPLLTTKNANGQIEGVKYDRVAAILVKGMQEQQTQIAELKAQNAQLESRITALEKNSPLVNTGVNITLDLNGFVLAGLLLGAVMLYRAKK